MPARPPKPCAWPGCNLLVMSGSHCVTHKPMAEARQAEQLKRANKNYNTRRDESDSFYGTNQWRKFRAHYLKMHPLCVNCQEHNVVEVATVLDHIKPYKTHPELGLDWYNVRPLCRSCHARIGAKVGLNSGGG